ncbi:hypothetical protein EB796_000182 [Bugula neritina]|uniref:Uncharacterized protein n=1 Tax=Bugula neritina TaxID=10212 RepID=A0A7J7KTQ3_BUGNE|nr:hypothetical protein EB796_000182 [Bugula neritina]
MPTLTLSFHHGCATPTFRLVPHFLPEKIGGHGLSDSIHDYHYYYIYLLSPIVLSTPWVSTSLKETFKN